MDEDQRDGGRIARSVTVRAPIAEVWSAIATADGMEAWLGGEVELDPRPGKPVLVRWPDRSTSRGLVERVEHGRRFVFRWRRIEGAGLTLRSGDPTRVVIALSAAGEGLTRVDIEETPAPLPAPPVAVAEPTHLSARRGAA